MTEFTGNLSSVLNDPSLSPPQLHQCGHYEEHLEALRLREASRKSWKLVFANSDSFIDAPER